MLRCADKWFEDISELYQNTVKKQYLTLYYFFNNINSKKQIVFYIIIDTRYIHGKLQDLVHGGKIRQKVTVCPLT